MFETPGFLGTEAPIMIDITLVLEMLFFILLTVGVWAQRRNMWKVHDWIQTPVVILNAILVVWIMLWEYFGRDLGPQTIATPTPYFLWVTAHGIFGLAAAILSIYCLLAGWKILPRKIGQLKRIMWLTYIVWTIATVLGVITYIVWYV